MPKILVATFGWTEQYVLSSILRHGLERGDVVTLLVPAKEDEKSEIILRDFQSFLSRYGEGVDLEVERVSIESFDAAVSHIAEVLRNALSRGPEKLILNLSGGMRILILATYLAAILTCPRDVLIELETEDRERSYRVPSLTLRGLIKLREIEKMVLARLLEGPKSTGRLLMELRIPRSTLHKHLKTLRNLGLTEIEKEERMLIAKLTPLGRLILIGLEGGDAKS